VSINEEAYKIAVELVQDADHTQSGFDAAFVVVSLLAISDSKR
jgi:hypothetical protein